MSQSTIFGRVSQLVRANINDLIDRAEDPEKMLNQLVLDYTNAIDEARSAVGSRIGYLRLEEEDAREAREEAGEWGQKAKAASRKADSATNAKEKARLNELARLALTKQVNLETQADKLEAKVKADTDLVDGLKDGLNKMEIKLETLKSQRQDLLARAKMVQAQQAVQGALASVNAADPTSDLARFEDRIRGQEAQVAGMAELQSETLDEQFAALDQDVISNEVEARLAALKETVPV
jgi:phage shock protein A